MPAVLRSARNCAINQAAGTLTSALVCGARSLLAAPPVKQPAYRLFARPLPTGQVRAMAAGPKAQNIVWSDSLLTTSERSLLTGCRGATVWLTGLSGSGKSTVGALLEKRLIETGLLAYRLDGDNVRFGLNKDLGFSEHDRKENIRRIGEVCKLFTDSGVVTIASFISPYKSDRDAAREIFAKDKLPFFEVFVKVPLDVAESRDPKGLYKKARSGALKGFTGIDAPYEEPEAPELVLNTHETELEDCVQQCLTMLYKAGIKPPIRLDSVAGAP